MGRLTVAWAMAAGACGTIGLAHLAVWASRRTVRAHLLFGIAALAASANALAELATFKATTVAGYAAAHRATIATVAVLFVSMVWYARAYIGKGHPGFAIAVTVAWGAVLVVDAIDPTGPVFARIDGLRTAFTPWGEKFSVAVAGLDASRHLLDAADVLLAVFLVDIFVAMWRSGERRRIVRIAVSIGVLIAASLVQVRLVDGGFLDMPHIGSFVYLAVVTVAGYPLTADVVRVARMAERLRESEIGLIQSRRIAILSAEEARQAEEWFRRVFDAAPSGMILAEADGTIRLANPHAESLFGYRHGELVGMPFDTIVPREKGGGLPGPAIAARAAPVELRCRRKDGTEITAELGWSEVPSQDGRYLLATIVDSTERHRVELELARQRNELAHLSRLTTIGELAGSLAHELNQPLTAILANAQAAQRMLDRSPADIVEVNEILHDIVESDRHAGEVIGRLRTMLRKGTEEFEPLDATEIVQDALRLARSDLLNHGVAVTADLATGLPPIDGDRVQLLQVLLNLVLNGIDAVSKRPSDSRRIVFATGLADGGDGVHIRVTDTGPGIPDGSLERIFDPFFTTKAKGMGLGLSVCRTIVTAHRGRIEATNGHDGGATLHVVIPARPVASGANGPVRDAASDSLADPRTKV